MIVSYFYSTPYESFFQKCVKKKEKKKYNHLNSKRRVRLKVASNTKRYRKQVERASLRRPRRPSSHLSPLPDYCSCFSSTLLDPLFLSFHAKEREREREREERRRREIGREGERIFVKDRATMSQLKGSARPTFSRSGTELVLEAKLNRGAFQSTFSGKFHSDGGTARQRERGK